MALDDILKAIDTDAQKRIGEIEATSAKEIAAIDRAAKAMIDKAKDDLLTRAKREAEQLAEQTRFLAEAEVNSVILKKKQEIVDRVFTQAVDALAKLPANDQKSLMVDLLKNVPNLENGEIHPVKSSEAIVKKAAHEAKCSIPISPKMVSGAGGFLVTSRDLEIDNRYETLLIEFHDELESNVADILFGKETAA